MSASIGDDKGVWVRFKILGTERPTRLIVTIGQAKQVFVDGPDLKLSSLRALAIMPIATGGQPLSLEVFGACGGHDKTGQSRIVQVRP